MNLLRKKIIDYYDKLKNQVDVHFEKQINREKLSELQRAELHRIRESFIQKIDDLVKFSLNYLKLNYNPNNININNNDDNNDEFFIPMYCFFYEIYCQLVIINKFINEQIIHSLTRYDSHLSKDDQITSFILFSLLGTRKKFDIVDLSLIEENKIENFRLCFKENFFHLAESWFKLSNFSSLQIVFEQNERFPKAALSKLISLEKLKITSENGVIFEQDCFEGLQSLNRLEIHGELNKVFNGIFKHLDSLKELKLKFTHRTLFESNCFHGLENLVELWIFGYSYHLTNIQIDNLNNLSNLKKLIIHYNNFGPCDLKDLHNLKFVSFKNCILNNLKCSKINQNLISIDYSIETDRILEIDKEFFCNAKNLVFLNLSCFILDNFDVTVLNVLSNLEYLNIKKFIDSKYSYENMNLPKLKYLYIDSATVPNFLHLKLEYLSIENIKVFDHKNLLNQPDLIGLVLNKISHDEFNKLDKRHFRKFAKLIYFEFSFEFDSYSFDREKCVEFLNRENVEFIDLKRAYAISIYKEKDLSKLIENEVHFSNIALESYKINKIKTF